MIYVTRLNGEVFVVNCEYIELIESRPDTVITLKTGRKIVVKEDIQEVINRVIDYKRNINSNSSHNVVIRKEV